MLATFAPHVRYDLSTSRQRDWLPQREEDGEPAEHVGCVRWRVCVERHTWIRM